VPERVRVISQRGNGLAERLAASVDEVGGPVLVIGMDTPQVDAALLDDALDRLRSGCCDAVLGTAEDGGYWAIGLRRAERRAFEDVPMSTATTGARQLAALERLGLRVERLPSLVDVDHHAEACAVAATVPGSRFAAAVAVVEERLRSAIGGGDGDAVERGPGQEAVSTSCERCRNDTDSSPTTSSAATAAISAGTTKNGRPVVSATNMTAASGTR
jgi:hypothetical protein